MKIKKVSLTFVPEKLKAPFGFKGGFLSELWQVVCKVETEKTYGVGVGVQSVLWSDATIFVSNSEQVGNEYMFSITKKACELLENKQGETPIEIIDGIYEELLAYAQKSVSGNLRETFVKNSLVAVDNALWVAYARELNKQDFMEIIPSEYRKAFCVKHNALCNIPLISYGVKEQSIKELLDNKTALLKIKIGFDDNGKMTKSEMVQWDKNRLKVIHDVAKNYKTEYTKSGNVLYYLDANGKYDSKERLNEFLAFAHEIGAKDRIVLLEEPFEEENEVGVSDVDVRLASDESVHSLKDVEKRIDLGYKAIALKPIAKTLSETLKIVNCAYEKGVICFCADLTVNPLMVEWNKNVASRIQTLPEMNVGILESNGEQNYLNWDKMRAYSPSYGKTYSLQEQGIYRINEDFFVGSGDIFEKSNYYDNLLK